MDNLQQYDKETQQFLQSVWYILAEKIFKQIIDLTGLDKDREDALRSIVMRPNDFEICIDGYEITDSFSVS
jgi:hypothetical protein